MIAIVIEIFEVVEEFKVPWGFGVGIVPLMRGSRKMEIWQIVQHQLQQQKLKQEKIVPNKLFCDPYYSIVLCDINKCIMSSLKESLVFIHVPIIMPKHI